MTRIFVYEYACAQPPTAALPDSVRREGRAMWTAIMEDFGRIDGAEVVTLDASEQNEEAAFKELARSADWSLVIAPEFDFILEHRCRWVEESNSRLLGPGQRTVGYVADKWRLVNLLRLAGVPVPGTWFAGNQRKWPKPRVVKPRWGAGSLGVQLVSDPALVKSAKAHLVQEHIEGQPASVSLLMSPGQVLALLPCTQRLSADGTFQYLGGEAPLPPPLARRATALALQAANAILGLRGYIGVDLILGPDDDGSGDRVIEINPRLTTSYIGLRALALDNLAEVMLRLAEGESVSPLRWRAGAVRWAAAGEVGLM
jgi:predicted ATP-grasp superfamily ATP-dependent carboligase